MSAAGFLAMYTALGAAGAVPHPLNPKRRSLLGWGTPPHPDTEGEARHQVLLEAERSLLRKRAPSGPLRPINFEPVAGALSEHEEGAEVTAPSGNRWRTVGGYWILWVEWYKENGS
ncbi:MAG: hypothetical protein ACN6OP_10180 [Pseudomonadales bacterium]